MAHFYVLYHTGHAGTWVSNCVVCPLLELSSCVDDSFSSIDKKCHWIPSHMWVGHGAGCRRQCVCGPTPFSFVVHRDARVLRRWSPVSCTLPSLGMAGCSLALYVVLWEDPTFSRLRILKRKSGTVNPHLCLCFSLEKGFVSNVLIFLCKKC